MWFLRLRASEVFLRVTSTLWYESTLAVKARVVLVPWTGLEPAHLAKYAPQTYVSTNFTTRANFSMYEE